jgi:hypothetical protein
MGMYDSFYVNNEEYQTKELDCILDCYTLGDTVPNNGSMSSYYLVIGHDKQIGIIIIDNIFIHHCDPDNVEAIFKTYLVDARISQDSLTRILKEKNTKLGNAEGKLYRIGRILSDYDSYMKKEERWISTIALDKFNDGVSLYDVLTQEMETK